MWNELTKRVLFGLVAAPAFLGLMWLGGWYVVVTLMVIVGMMQWELATLLEAAHAPAFVPWSLVTGMIILLHSMNPFFVPSLIVMLLLLVTFTVRPSKTERFTQIMSSVFLAAYIPFMMSTLLALRTFGDEPTGFYLILLLFFTVWGNDSLAYFGGRWLGKHPMAPAISPKKTWEGFFFGILGAALGFLLMFAVMPASVSLDPFKLWPLVLLISVFGPVGDLAESLMKRYVNVKDSGNWLPGHGGFLDRFDALILAAPVTWIYVFIVLCECWKR